MGIITSIITAQTPYLRQTSNNRKKDQLGKWYHTKKKTKTKNKTKRQKRLALMS